MRSPLRTRLAPIAALSLLTAALLTRPAPAGHGPTWGYAGETGPEHWGGLSPDYAMCAQGVNQSPVDIEDPLEADLGPLEFEYRTQTTDVVNNGHTLQVNVEAGSTLAVEGQQVELTQFHFHSPSEHAIQGRRYPLEVHFVHRGTDGHLTVVGMLADIGQESEDFGRILAAASQEVGASRPLALELSTIKIVATTEKYYRYSGSLTTPPCTEGVRWLISKEIGALSREQVGRFTRLIGKDARPIQPLNARIVLER